MSSNAQEIVLEFIGAFGDSWPKDLDATLGLLAEDVTYQLVVPTSPPYEGRAAVKDEILGMMKRVPDQNHEMKNVASNGRTVFTERVDHTLINGKWTTLPIVGVFDVNEAGQITSWREYMDLVHVSREYDTPLDRILRGFEPRKS